MSNFQNFVANTRGSLLCGRPNQERWTLAACPREIFVDNSSGQLFQHVGKAFRVDVDSCSWVYLCQWPVCPVVWVLDGCWTPTQCNRDRTVRRRGKDPDWRLWVTSRRRLRLVSDAQFLVYHDSRRGHTVACHFVLLGE
jgi:hypothetical protein